MFSEAFDLKPNSGYKLANFQISVKKPYYLDFEDTLWRSFIIEIVSQELGISSHSSKKELAINLINWNDERPEFSQSGYIVDVSENAGKGFRVAKVMATDRDVDDHVFHCIVGNTTGAEMEEESGIIILSEDNVLDYERQSTLILQIMARDSLVTDYSNTINTVYTQLTINIIDVNDVTPVLIMPRVRTNVSENSVGGTLVSSLVQARDPDTTAKLKFHILWEKSFATKEGQEAERKFYEGCFLIETNEINQHTANGLLVVNPEFQLKYEIDYEKYDTIFLTLRVTDLNQEHNINFGEELLTVRIIDVNDNAPEFNVDTLGERRKVVENEDLHTVIGQITAFDIDGPGHNKITYSLRPIGKLTRDGLVTIDENSGVLKVTNLIQCDIPKIENLEYEITLSDSVYHSFGNIKIYIVDVNNMSPQIGIFQQQVSIYENATSGFNIGQIIAKDDDRDEPHNILQYTINNAGSSVLKNLFNVNISTGKITLNIRNGAELDRDNGITFHLLNVDVMDNFDINNFGYGPSNLASTFINITLIDINDNAPHMPLKSEFRPHFFEQDLKGTLCNEKLISTDNDEPNTPNSMISYTILNIQPVSQHNINAMNYSDLFGIRNKNMFGQIIAQKNLMGYYGIWEITIKSFDNGDPIMWNISSYELNVRPYNFHSPLIIFPVQEKPLRLCMFQEINKPLLDADCISPLRAFEAFDPDGGIFGDCNFTLSSENGDDIYFLLLKENRNRSHLQLKTRIRGGIYKLNVAAVDGDGKESTIKITDLKVAFIDMQGSPMFTINEFKTNFTENENGLLEVRQIPEAEDPKNVGINDESDIYRIYYFIDETFRPSDAKNFVLNKDNRQLKLSQTLDREIVDNYTIRVRVTNNKNGNINNRSHDNFLTIYIKVNDVNDNSPVFNETHYAAGITVKDVRGKHVLTYFAYDPDCNDLTSYVIDKESFRTHGENIELFKYNMFELDKTTGVLKLSTPVSSNMKGYLMFEVIAYDTDNPAHFDTVSSKIYIIAESNRVKFVFLSSIEVISRNEKFIRKEFENMYGYHTCNIDSIEDIGNLNLNATDHLLAPITAVIAHFIHNNEAVESIEIQKRSDDLRFISMLQNSLQRQNLILNDVPHSKHEEVQHNLENLLTTILIAVSTILVTLCLMLVIAFVMKTRALNRKLKAFEPPVFGSTTSNLNRLGAPTTNIFSVEGSNPVITNKVYSADSRNDINRRGSNDTSLESEDDCDFLGITNDPIFVTKGNHQFINEEA